MEKSLFLLLFSISVLVADMFSSRSWENTIKHGFWNDQVTSYIHYDSFLGLQDLNLTLNYPSSNFNFIKVKDRATIQISSPCLDRIHTTNFHTQKKDDEFRIRFLLDNLGAKISGKNVNFDLLNFLINFSNKELKLLELSSNLVSGDYNAKNFKLSIRSGTVSEELSSIEGFFTGDYFINFSADELITNYANFKIKFSGIALSLYLNPTNFVSDLLSSGTVSSVKVEANRYIYEFSDLKFSFKILNLDRNFYLKKLNLESIYEILSQNFSIDILNFSFKDLLDREVFISGKFGVKEYAEDLLKALFVDLSLNFDKEYIDLFTKGDDEAKKALFDSGILKDSLRYATTIISKDNDTLFINNDINLNTLIQGSKYDEKLKTIVFGIYELDGKKIFKKEPVGVILEDINSLVSPCTVEF
ncbi:MAG: hypothetical protein GXZ15_02815 [Campylobacter sp.]|nr:hypothetical protein [Campylobacter sp.]